MKKPVYDPTYRFTFHPRHVTVIPRPYSSGRRLLNLNNATPTGGLIKQHNGQVSPNAKRKIRTAIDWLIASAEKKYLYSKKTGKFHPWYLSFCTLTLPTQGELGDKEVKQILNAWLTQAKYSFGLRSYIWKAEPQARGTIHIHITSDCFMWHTKVRHSWNKLLTRYQLTNGHENPNSTDIHSTYKLMNVAAYLCKYFCKESADRRNIEGRLWGCSQTLSNARGIRFHMKSEETKQEKYFLRQEAHGVNSKEFCETFYMPNEYLKTLPPCKLKSLFIARQRQIRKKKFTDQYEIYTTDGQLVTDSNILHKFAKQLKPQPNGKS